MRFRAAVLHSAESPLSIEEVRLERLGPEDVLVEMEAAGLCHTDFEAQQGSYPVKVPMVLGHEGAGRVVETGPNVTRVRVGDRVVCALYPSCGQCFYCRRGQRALCETVVTSHRSGTLLDGKTRLVGHGGTRIGQLLTVGSFAEYAVLPEQGAIPIPEGVPPDRACIIACAVPTGFGAVTRVARVTFGSSVAVVGCGPVGLSVIQGARAVGAETIIAIDKDEARLGCAVGYGAGHAVRIDPSPDNAVEQVRALTGGRGADFVFEAAGVAEAFQVSLDVARPGADVVLLGKVDPGAEIRLRFGSLMGEKRVVRASLGGACCHDDFPAFANAYLRGALDLDSLISHRLTLDEVNEGLEMVGDRTAIRAVLRLRDVA